MGDNYSWVSPSVRSLDEDNLLQQHQAILQELGAQGEAAKIVTNHGFDGSDGNSSTGSFPEVYATSGNQTTGENGQFNHGKPDATFEAEQKLNAELDAIKRRKKDKKKKVQRNVAVIKQKLRKKENQIPEICDEFKVKKYDLTYHIGVSMCKRCFPRGPKDGKKSQITKTITKMKNPKKLKKPAAPKKVKESKISGSEEPIPPSSRIVLRMAIMLVGYYRFEQESAKKAIRVGERENILLGYPVLVKGKKVKGVKKPDQKKTKYEINPNSAKKYLKYILKRRNGFFEK